MLVIQVPSLLGLAPDFDTRGQHVDEAYAAVKRAIAECPDAVLAKSIEAAEDAVARHRALAAVPVAANVRGHAVGTNGGRSEPAGMLPPTREKASRIDSGGGEGYATSEASLKVTKDRTKWRSLTTLPFVKHGDDFYLEVRNNIDLELTLFPVSAIRSEHSVNFATCLSVLLWW